MRCRFALLLLFSGLPTLAQDAPPPLRRIPDGVILVKGAEPSASDSATPVPERGVVTKNVYRNDYFGVTFTLPDGVGEKYKGPPPSDSGAYVLTQLEAAQKPTVLVTAQDDFFTLAPGIEKAAAALPSYYELERPLTNVKLAGRDFVRYDYRSSVAGLHWIVLSTAMRCHSLQFVINGRNAADLDAIVRAIDAMKFAETKDVPRCVSGYAVAKNMIEKSEPLLTDHRFNPIPVRITIDRKGNVKHVHVISAFPQQARVITDALMKWKFKPNDVEIETGIMFGNDPRRQLAQQASAKSGD
jgi:hypothetical protein